MAQSGSSPFPTWGSGEVTSGLVLIHEPFVPA